MTTIVSIFSLLAGISIGIIIGIDIGKYKADHRFLKK